MTVRYLGLHAATGAALTELDHIRQSLRVILTTPLGSRVMRREFGSLLPDLLDRPLNGTTQLQLIAACVMAITRWESRVELQRVSLQAGESAGFLQLAIELRRRDQPATALQSLQLPLRGST
ncbi:GPW/gp25 family protein [Chitinivorax sp. B]|uniref:GPW/gp25 family protein n=1 Tax=Chitinivorax sp. B TaxID=2502235 RepID=UPI0010F8BBAB|nr:GPW/gp25 family protein [Chitinivorax sp. B]